LVPDVVDQSCSEAARQLGTMSHDPGVQTSVAGFLIGMGRIVPGVDAGKHRGSLGS